MIADKGKENQPFLQSDVFKQMKDSKTVAADIQQFKDDFRVKTIYEKFKGLYQFGNKFKFILSLLTASLAIIGLFFLFYIEGFTGWLNSLFMGLSSIFALSFSFGLEYGKYTLSPIISKSYLRDGEFKTSLATAYLLVVVMSTSSTVYGTYKLIDLYYTPELVTVGDVGTEQEHLIAEYQAKIAKADMAKASIDNARVDYKAKTGNNSSWIDAKVYNQLTTDIATYEKEIITLRKQKRTDQQVTKGNNEKTKAKHTANKYAFVWVGGIVSFLCELGLLVVLFLLQYYKYSTLEQLDSIQSPIQAIFNLVDNPLTELKAHLLGGNRGFAITSGANTSGLQIATNALIATNQNEQEPTQDAPTHTGAKIGFQYGQKTEQKKGEINAKISTELEINKRPKPLEFQQVSTKELAKIELNIMRYEKRVSETESKIKTLKQQAAINRQKKVLKNRRDTLRYWENRKAAYQGKILG